MRKQSIATLTEGPVGATILKLAGFMMIGIVGMMAFNLLDTYFVGQLGKDELAAISFTFPVVMVVNGIALGVGVGASSVIAHAIGEKDFKKVRRLTTDALILAFSIVTVFTLIGIFSVEKLFLLLGAQPDLLGYIKDYMKIWYLGMPFVVIPMVGNSAIRATGDTKTPSLIMLVAIFINLILDPILIFGLGPFPKMGIQGAALSTVIARSVTFTLSLYILSKREKMITLSCPSLQAVFSSWKQILYIGIPATITNLVIPLSMGFITRLIASFGKSAVAAFGVSTRIELFVMAVIMSLSSVIIPFIGQNRGARKQDRILEGINFGKNFSLFWGGILFVLFLIFSRSLAGIFNEGQDIIDLIQFYLITVSLSYGTLGITMISSSGFNALNKPLHATSISLIQMAGLYLPLAYIGAMFLQVKGIFIAAAVSNLLAGGIGYIWIRKSISSLQYDRVKIGTDNQVT